MDRILLPQTTISTTSVASPNTVKTSVTANSTGFTVNIDKDLDIESVETEDIDNDTRAPREQTSVHIDDIKPVKLGTSKRTTIGFYTIKPQAPPAKEMRKQVLQDALEQPLQEPGSVQGHLRTGLLSLYPKTADVKIISLEPQVTTDRVKTMQGKTDETPMSRKTQQFVPSSAEKETMDGHKAMLVDLFTIFPETHSAQPDHVKSVGDTDTQISVVTTASSEHSVTGVSSSDLVPRKSAADTMSMSPDKPTVTIVSGSHKSVDVQCSSLTWIIRHHVSKHTEHRQAATQGDGATTQRSDVSMASTIAMRATEESSRIQTTFEPYTENIVITPSVYVAPRGVLNSLGSEFKSETHTRTHACLSQTNFSIEVLP